MCVLCQPFDAAHTHSTMVDGTLLCHYGVYHNALRPKNSSASEILKWEQQTFKVVIQKFVLFPTHCRILKYYLFGPLSCSLDCFVLGRIRVTSDSPAEDLINPSYGGFDKMVKLHRSLLPLATHSLEL